MQNTCNNCGKRGHSFHQCKLPITSNGIIAFRINPHTKQREYLMICRRETLGFIDFLRGKYLLNNKYYISNMIKQMTQTEKQMLATWEFDDLWKYIWRANTNETPNICNQEESISKEKFYQLKTDPFENLQSLLDKDTNTWNEPEWGFPKGRREPGENDLVCALREFSEETGFTPEIVPPPGLNIELKTKLIENLMPFEEIFMGSNYKCYKHRYYLMFMDYEYSEHIMKNANVKNKEISDMQWIPFIKCVHKIRPYNLEKIRMLVCIQTALSQNCL